MINFQEAESLRHNYNHHPPNLETIGLHKEVRALLFEVATKFGAHLPDCRERSIAWTKLEEAMFWANAAIARHISSTDPNSKKAQNQEQPDKPKIEMIDDDTMYKVDADMPEWLIR